MDSQLMLPFRDRKVALEPTVLVKLSELDMAYRQSCLDKEDELGNVPFTESFLKETRAQRIGCSVRDMDCMLRYELNRHLADEAALMCRDDWATARETFINWEVINQRAKIRSEELAQDFAEFRKMRRESMIERKKLK